MLAASGCAGEPLESLFSNLEGSLAERKPNASSLIKCLRSLHQSLSSYDSPISQSQVELLLSEKLLSHRDLFVTSLTSCCIASALRLFAPNHPFKDERQLERVLSFLVDSLENLSNWDSSYFQFHFYLLESLASVRSILLILETTDEAWCNLMLRCFQTLLNSLSPKHSVSVKQLVRESLLMLVDECDFVPPLVVALLMERVFEKGGIVGELLAKCATKIEPFICRYLMDRFEPKQLREAFPLIFELFSLSQELLLSYYGQLEELLQESDDSAERLAVIECVGRFASDPRSLLPDIANVLWSCWLGRGVKERSSRLRLAWIPLAVACLPVHRNRSTEIQLAIACCLADGDDRVRSEIFQSLTSGVSASLLLGEKQVVANAVLSVCSGEFRNASLLHEAMSVLIAIFNAGRERKLLDDILALLYTPSRILKNALEPEIERFLAETDALPHFVSLLSDRSVDAVISLLKAKETIFRLVKAFLNSSIVDPFVGAFSSKFGSLPSLGEAAAALYRAKSNLLVSSFLEGDSFPANFIHSAWESAFQQCEQSVEPVGRLLFREVSLRLSTRLFNKKLADGLLKIVAECECKNSLRLLEAIFTTIPTLWTVAVTEVAAEVDRSPKIYWISLLYRMLRSNPSGPPPFNGDETAERLLQVPSLATEKHTLRLCFLLSAVVCDSFYSRSLEFSSQQLERNLEIWTAVCKTRFATISTDYRKIFAYLAKEIFVADTSNHQALLDSQLLAVHRLVCTFSLSLSRFAKSNENTAAMRSFFEAFSLKLFEERRLPLGGFQDIAKAFLYRVKFFPIDVSDPSAILPLFFPVCHHPNFEVRDSFYRGLESLLERRRASLHFSTLFPLAAVDPEPLIVRRVEQSSLQRARTLLNASGAARDRLLLGLVHSLLTLLAQHPELQYENSHQLQTFELFLSLFTRHVLCSERDANISWGYTQRLKGFSFVAGKEAFTRGFLVLCDLFIFVIGRHCSSVAWILRLPEFDFQEISPAETLLLQPLPVKEQLATVQRSYLPPDYFSHRKETLQPPKRRRKVKQQETSEDEE